MPCRYSPPVSPAQAHLTSRYGVRLARRPPHAPTFHAGIDLGPLSGVRSRDVQIRAVGPGTIAVIGLDATHRGPMDGYGNCIAIAHDDGRWSFCAHLSAFAGGLAVGQTVRAGQLLGMMGSTTNGKFPGMGAHCHFEVRHAFADGRAPFPGPYPHIVAGVLNNPLNEDPQLWLAERGITFGARGRIELNAALACAPEAFA